MPQSVFDTWSRRGDALNATIQQTMHTMRQRRPAVERQQTLLSLLTALQAFGESQLAFFIDGFGSSTGNGTATSRLEPSTTYPPEYAMRVTVDQIAYDLDVIQRAYTQRQPGLATDDMLRTLAKADILAYNALAPAIEQDLITNTTVITYFQKSVNVRILPYAPVALIGLPLTAQQAPRDLLAIPHEVGHYVYRNGKATCGQFPGSRFAAALRYELQRFPKWCQAWAEEIFADVYGAVIGGPIMALAFEELVIRDRIADFTHDDGEHPVAAIRPDIYHEVFTQLQRHPVESDLLEKRWNSWFERRGAPASFTPANEEEWWDVELPEAKAEIKKAIALILAGDLGKLKADQALWSATLAEGADVEELYRHFDQVVLEQLPDTTEGKVPEVALLDDQDTSFSIYLPEYTSTRSPDAIRCKVGDTGLWIDAVKQDRRGINMPPEVWMQVLDGSGWAVEGPGSNAH